MLDYNSSQADCGTIDTGTDTLAGRSTRSTIGVGRSTSLGLERLPNGLLFLFGLFLIAYAFFNVDGSTDAEMSEFLGL